MKTEFEIDLDDELLEQAFRAAPEGTTLEALIEMSLNAWIYARSNERSEKSGPCDTLPL